MRINLTLLLLFLVSFAFAKPVLQTKVPLKIEEAFKVKYPSARAGRWMLKNNIYTVSFMEGKARSISIFDITGNWKGTETTIKFMRSLPLQVRREFLRGKFSAWYICSIKRFIAPEVANYQLLVDNSSTLDGDHHDALLERRLLEFSVDGALISKELIP